MIERSSPDSADWSVEIWNGDRKVTIHRDAVLRIWGINIDTEMSEEPRTLETMQAAMDWLYRAPAQAAQSDLETAREILSELGEEYGISDQQIVAQWVSRLRTQPQGVSEADVIIVAGRLRALNALKEDYGQVQHEKVRKALEAISLSRPHREGEG